MSARWRLVDTHCHLDRMANAEAVARDAATRGIAVFDTTVTPADAERARAVLGGCGNVRVGAGLHPWWLADGRCGEDDIARTADLAARSPFIGEVGLDFGRRGDGTRELQLDAFDRIASAIASNPLPHRVLSIHAIASAGAALDVLERYNLVGPDAPQGTVCIFHWFSGSSDELARARRAGCLFSVSEHMLASKRGREYARQLPEGRLLLETDAPPGLDTPYSADALEASLMRALGTLAELRSTDEDSLARSIAHTSERLMDLGR